MTASPVMRARACARAPREGAPGGRGGVPPTGEPPRVVHVAPLPALCLPRAGVHHPSNPDLWGDDPPPPAHPPHPLPRVSNLPCPPVRLPQAMFVNFGMAEQYGGQCYLRYDDTNPEAEKLEYIQHIEVRPGPGLGGSACV